MKNKKGFTLIEILLIVSIIGILSAIILAVGVGGGRNRAAIASYKTTMNSVKTAMELCGSGNINIGNHPGNDTVKICNIGHEKTFYPVIDNRCGVNEFEFISGEIGPVWAVSTSEECKGCRILCTIEGCGPYDSGYEDACK